MRKIYLYIYIYIYIYKMNTSLENAFYYSGALELNKARILHLDSLNLDFDNKKILETGCGGKGDITSFFLKKTDDITLNDTRLDNINYLKSNLHRTFISLNEKEILVGKNLCSNTWDLNNDFPTNTHFDVIVSYGTLYHLENPANAIKNLSAICKEFMILSTAGNGQDNGIQFIEESNEAAQSYTLKGCRPSRKWVYDEFKKYFKYIYIPISQPDHPDFKKVWPTTTTCRFIIIGSHIELNNPNLTTEMPNIYT
jgi:2-polyprenyl-3-methyl-5-hydroxy-6-metoxy-1,4-benzoquinol methylase